MLMPCQLINIFGHVPPFITRPGTLGWTNNNTHTHNIRRTSEKNTHTYIEGRFIAARDLANRGIWSRLQPGQDGPGLSSALTPALQLQSWSESKSEMRSRSAMYYVQQMPTDAWRRHK